MKTYSFYHRESGVFHRAIFSTDDPGMLAPNTPEGHVALEGRYSAAGQRFDAASNHVIEIEAGPSPHPDFEWSRQDNRYVLSDAGRARRAARQRIAELESTQPRVLREAALGQAGALARLQAIDNEITQQRVALK